SAARARDRVAFARNVRDTRGGGHPQRAPHLGRHLRLPHVGCGAPRPRRAVARSRHSSARVGRRRRRRSEPRRSGPDGIRRAQLPRRQSRERRRGAPQAMIAPRGLLGAALVLWGASTGHFALGVALCIAFEAVRFARGSPQSSRRQILVIRASLFASAALLAYTVAASRFPEALYLWLRWLPLALLPLAALQALAGGSIAWATIGDALRPGHARDVPRGGVDTTYPLLAIILVGAATGNGMDKRFYPAGA